MSKQEVVHSGGEQQAKRVRSRRRFLTGVVTGGLLGSLLAGSVSVFSHMKHGPGWWSHAGRGSCGYSRHGAHDPKTAGERAAFASDWILGRIDASEEQRQQVQTLVQDAVGDLLQMKEQHCANREALLAALAQPTIDREVLGDIRQVELQLIDAASERLVGAVADVADLLTLEQRTELLELAARFHR